MEAFVLEVENLVELWLRRKRLFLAVKLESFEGHQWVVSLVHFDELLVGAVFNHFVFNWTKGLGQINNNYFF